VIQLSLRLLSVLIAVAYVTAGVYAFVEPTLKRQIEHHVSLWILVPLLLAIVVTILSVRRAKE
jgi:membrane protein DedA with SNARE-associated domain